MTGRPIKSTPFWVFIIVISGLNYVFFVRGKNGAKPTNQEIKDTMIAYDKTKTQRLSAIRLELANRYKQEFEIPDESDEFGEESEEA